MTLSPSARSALTRARKQFEADRTALKRQLAQQYCLPLTGSGFQAAWEYAWEQGHSAGLQEVEMYFHEVMRVVRAFDRAEWEEK